ncbi:unnamed protein product [Nippostrongylus brasiliensis]|uniref:Uncharacterized protein n=1 Tax=Nippostrongylus brasiliensis TaxID=27835 RepID=A0A0N4YNX8_NIPBR|nr:unnamed protein product [Nippostrongylus brasiliensis]
MDDVAVSSSYEGGLSMLLSACAPPLSLDDDFELGWHSFDRKKEIKSDSLDGFDSLANSPLSHLADDSQSSSPSSPKKTLAPLRPSSISLFSTKPTTQFPVRHATHLNPQRGDHLVVDHEEEPKQQNGNAKDETKSIKVVGLKIIIKVAIKVKSN